MSTNSLFWAEKKWWPGTSPHNMERTRITP